MENAFAETVTIVTGAASGIGRATALIMGRQGGAGLVLVDRDGAALESVAVEIAAGGGGVLPLTLDIACEADTRQMAQTTLERFGRIDHLVAAAGILRATPELKTVLDTPLDEWRKVIDINLTGTFLCNQAVLPTMLSQRRGDIINISSVSGRQGRAFDAAYSATKAGIIGLSESLSEEVAGQGVRVQTLLPDAVDTPFWDQNGGAAFAKPPQAMDPMHVASFIVWMLSMPRDSQLLNPLLVPFRQKRGTRKGRA